MSERKEPAQETAKRRWANNDIRKRYKESQQEFAPDDPNNPFVTAYGKKQKPTLPPAARVITPSDDDIETIEKQRAKRVKTVAELRKVTKFLQDIIRSGRGTITVRGAELKGPRREATLAGYRASLEMRKRRLLLEKLRRLEAAQEQEA